MIRPHDRVSVRGSIPKAYGHPLADVVTVGPVAAKVHLCCDGSEWRIPHEQLAPRPTTAMLEHTFVVIPCSSRKADTAGPAATFYCGSYFRACLAAARALTVDRNIVVLSAKHGFLWLTDEVEPYDVKMGEDGSITPEQLAVTAFERGIYSHVFNDADLDNVRVVVFGGSAYRDMALTFFPGAYTPLHGLAGIGEHLQVLRRITDQGALDG